MREDLEDLLISYRRKVEELSKLLLSATSNDVRIRLTAKRGIYVQVIMDLVRLLNDHEEDEYET